MCFQKVLNDEFIILNRLHLRSNEHNQSTFSRIINVSLLVTFNYFLCIKDLIPYVHNMKEILSRNAVRTFEMIPKMSHMTVKFY